MLRNSFRMLPLLLALALAPFASAGLSEPFDSVPSWNSQFDASWGSVANFTAASGGEDGGSYLQGSRSSGGSSSRVIWANVQSGSDVNISIYLNCPSGGGYWMETAYQVGSHSGDEMDSVIASWTMIQKFDDSNNGNGGQWVQYTATISSVPSNIVSIGLKLGASGSSAPLVGWDTLIVDDGTLVSPTPTATDTPAGPTDTPGGPTNTPTFTPSGPTATPTSFCNETMCFESLPSWNSQFDAAWGGTANWSIASSGGAPEDEGAFLQASRSSGGSSSKVLWLSGDSGATMNLSVWIMVPSGSNYWVETAYQIGSHSGEEMDTDIDSWTMMVKFDDSNNGNGGMWTEYTAQIAMGGASTVSLGLKLGSSGGASPVVGWDNVNFANPSWTATPTPIPPTSTPTNTPVGPTATNTSAGPTPTNTVICPEGDIDSDNLCDNSEGQPPVTGQSHRWLDDSDGDGLVDGAEDVNGNGVKDVSETSTRNDDSDGDNYMDGIEVFYETDPLDPNDPDFPHVDQDNDFWPVQYDDDDDNPDIDADGYKDGFEVAKLGEFAARSSSVKPSLGDLNKDGVVGNLDALIVHSIFLGTFAPPQDIFNGDGFVNGDMDRNGEFTNLDALMTQAFFMKVVNEIPVQ